MAGTRKEGKIQRVYPFMMRVITAEKRIFRIRPRSLGPVQQLWMETAAEEAILNL
jgi:hypothetical protein